MRTLVDLFSGAGGMSAGFVAEGWTVVAAVDAQRGKPSGSSPRPNATYAANLGTHPWDDDLARADPGALRSRTGLAPGELDVLVACAPCTGFSQKNAANHATDDARNSLVRRAAHFVAAFRPRALVMENVKELLTGRHRHHFDGLRADLTGLGYRVRADVHDLTAFGLPQRRMRALLLATRDGDPPAPAAAGRGRPRTVRDAIGALPPVGQGAAHASDAMHVCPGHTPTVSARIAATPPDGGSWTDVAASRPDLLIPSMVGKRPGSFPDVYGRMRWDAPAPTITRECGHPGNGRYLHPEQHRLLTVREMALLQGFPPEWTFLGSLAARYNQIGDAVPPLVARRIARALR